MADNGHMASTPTRTRLSSKPHCQPSFLARGLPSSTRFGVAIQVLRKSIPRAKTSSSSNRQYSRLANGKVTSIIFSCRKSAPGFQVAARGFLKDRKRRVLGERVDTAGG